jgi:hypothetical protein
VGLEFKSFMSTEMYTSKAGKKEKHQLHSGFRDGLSLVATEPNLLMTCIFYTREVKWILANN